MDGLAPQGLLHWALIGAGCATFTVFAVALQNFFVAPVRHDRRIQLIHDSILAVGVIHLVGLLFRPPPSQNYAVAGLLMYSAALALFLAAIEAGKDVRLTRVLVTEPRPEWVVTTGPYRWVRHPIYVAYSLAWFAAPVGNLSLTLFVTAGAMAVLYVISARMEEANLLGSPLGEKYRAYRARTWWAVPFLI